MKKLIMLKGLPGSGKSTWAREQVRNSQGAIKRVNKDDLRAMLDDGIHSKGREQFILKIRDAIISSTLLAGHSVIVDDTNFAPKHEINLRNIATSLKVPFEVEFFDTPIEECIKRDLARPVSVGEGVIREMHDRYLKPEDAVYVPPEGKPEAILCDIDGTLAHMGDTRSPYEWEKVGGDSVDQDIADLINTLNDHSHIILVSGRDASCRKQTEDWLSRYDIDYDVLLMRPAGDKRKDTIVKREMFYQAIRDHYQVRFVLDDRDQVVEMWRSLGLKCLQVAPGAF